MADELKLRALALFTPPFEFYRGYIFDAEHSMVADQYNGEDLRVRGWGRIQKMPDAEALQDAAGALIAEALTEYWNRRAAPSAEAAPVAEGELPPLPKPPDGYVAMTPEGSVFVPPTEYRAANCYTVYSAEQVRQAQRAAIAADRATRQGEPVAYLTADKRMLVFADRVEADRAYGMTPLYAAPTLPSAPEGGAA
jgi:hypothetical protein